jgi:hypothetical protein
MLLLRIIGVTPALTDAVVPRRTMTVALSRPVKREPDLTTGTPMSTALGCWT